MSREKYRHLSQSALADGIALMALSLKDSEARKSALAGAKASGASFIKLVEGAVELDSAEALIQAADIWGLPERQSNQCVKIAIAAGALGCFNALLDRGYPAHSLLTKAPVEPYQRERQCAWMSIGGSLRFCDQREQEKGLAIMERLLDPSVSEAMSAWEAQESARGQIIEGASRRSTARDPKERKLAERELAVWLRALALCVKKGANLGQALESSSRGYGSDPAEKALVAFLSGALREGPASGEAAALMESVDWKAEDAKSPGGLFARLAGAMAAQAGDFNEAARMALLLEEKTGRAAHLDPRALSHIFDAGQGKGAFSMDDPRVRLVFDLKERAQSSVSSEELSWMMERSAAALLGIDKKSLSSGAPSPLSILNAVSAEEASRLFGSNMARIYGHLGRLNDPESCGGALALINELANEFGSMRALTPDRVESFVEKVKLSSASLEATRDASPKRSARSI